MYPGSMASGLGITSPLDYSIVKNNVTLEQAELNHKWLNSTTIRLIPENLPSSSLWKGEGCEGTVESGELKKKIRFQNDQKREFTVSQFHSVVVTCNSNGYSKDFEFTQPFEDVKFAIMNKPVIRISNSRERGKVSFSFQLSTGDEILRKKEKFISPSSKHTVVDEIPVPLEWYRNLENMATLTVDLWIDGSSYKDSFQLEIHPPRFSFFQPKPVAITSLVSPTEGYVVDFQLEPLSPRLKNFDGSFIQENGKEINFSVTDGKARITFPPTFDNNSTLREVRGKLRLGDYSNQVTLPTLECVFHEYCSITNPDSLKRTSEEKMMLISATENFHGTATVRFEHEKIHQMNSNSANQQSELKDDFEFNINGNSEFSIKEIRDKIKLIDEYFVQFYPEEISLEIALRPFDNTEKFGEHIVQFKILRDDDFVTALETPPYLEGGDAQCWKFNYSDLYFPKKEQFKMSYCGIFFEPEKIDKEDEISFIIQPQEYNSVFSNPKWMLSYNDKEVEQGVISIPEIIFNERNHIIDVFYSEDGQDYSSFDKTIGVFDSRGQDNVKVEISILIIGLEKEKALTFEKEINEIMRLEFSSLQDFFLRYHDHISTINEPLIGQIQLKIPSRDRLLTTISLRLGVDNTLATDCKRWVEDHWDKTIAGIEQISDTMKPVCVFIISEGLKPFFDYFKNTNTCFEVNKDKAKNQLNCDHLLNNLEKKSPHSLNRIFHKRDGERWTKYNSDTIKKAGEWRQWWNENKNHLDNPELQKIVNPWKFKAKEFWNSGPLRLVYDFKGNTMEDYITWLKNKLRVITVEKMRKYVQTELDTLAPPVTSSRNLGSKNGKPFIEAATRNPPMEPEKVEKPNTRYEKPAHSSKKSKSPYRKNNGQEELKNWRDNGVLPPKPKNQEKKTQQKKNPPRKIRDTKRFSPSSGNSHTKEDIDRWYKTRDFYRKQIASGTKLRRDELSEHRTDRDKITKKLKQALGDEYVD